MSSLLIFVYLSALIVGVVTFSRVIYARSIRFKRQETRRPMSGGAWRLKVARPFDSSGFPRRVAKKRRSLFARLARMLRNLIAEKIRVDPCRAGTLFGAIPRAARRAGTDFYTHESAERRRNLPIDPGLQHCTMNRAVSHSGDVRSGTPAHHFRRHP